MPSEAGRFCKLIHFVCVIMVYLIYPSSIFLSIFANPLFVYVQTVITVYVQTVITNKLQNFKLLEPQLNRVQKSHLLE